MSKLVRSIKNVAGDIPLLNELLEMPLPMTPLDPLRLIWKKYHHLHTNHKQNLWKLWIC